MCCVLACVEQSSPLTFHYVIVSQKSVVSRPPFDVSCPMRSLAVSPARKRRSLDSSHTPPSTSRYCPDPKSATDEAPNNVDSADPVPLEPKCTEARLECTASKPGSATAATSNVELRQESSSTQQSTAASKDDDCLSISTSVTVVISRRPAAAAPSAPSAQDQTATDDSDSAPAQAALGGDHSQLVVSTTIPAKMAPSQQQPEVEMSPGADEPRSGQPPAAKSESSTSSTHVTGDVRPVTGNGRLKRKSLESVIRSLQPTPVSVSRPPEVVARSRPEMLVRPIQACAAAAGSNQLPVSTKSPCLVGQRFSPKAVDLRRPRRPVPTGSSLVQGIGRRKPKSLSPLQAPSIVDDPYSYSDKRRRFSSGVGSSALPTSGRLHGGYFSPTVAGIYGQAAVAAAAAARYHACVAAARSEMTQRLPVYYNAMPRRVDPNGYDAPLELTTKSARDRK